MRTGAIVLLGLLLTWGLATPLRAQRFGNSSLDFYEQGLQQLEQEIQRLQVEPAQQQMPLLTPSKVPPQPIESTAPVAPPPSVPTPSQPSPPPAINSEQSPS